MKSTPRGIHESPGPAEQNASAEQAYREMIQQVARAMAGNNVEGAVAYLSPEFTARHVELFVDGNFEKRVDVLLRLMPLVSEDDDFEDFESLAEEFADTVPVAAYEGSSEECDAMLAWMQETLELTPSQRDTVNCQRARYAVEFLARRKRAEHVRFQEQVSVASSLARDLPRRESLRLVVNPIHVWTDFVSRKYLETTAPVPRDVLTWADDREVRTSTFEPAGRAYFESLLACQPCSFAEWTAMNLDADPDELLEFIGTLVSLRLVALL